MVGKTTACSRHQTASPLQTQGAFGKVFQVRHRASGRLYAMKVMRKERILERDHGDYVKAERDVLTVSGVE